MAGGLSRPVSWVENTRAACWFYFSLSPEAGSLWKRSHKTPPGTVAAPCGVARSQLTTEKTAPRLPAVCFCSQKCFYSYIHLFTT